MIHIALTLVLAIQPAQAFAADAPQNVTRASATDAPAKRIYVKDSSKAANVETADVDAEICVRSLVPGSRVKARTVCQNKAAWKAYVEAQDAMNREWDLTGIGLPSDTDFVGPAGG
ncbi:hypothetical protein OAS19_05765 [Altererythrobacter sp.]|nr:hypothetical protein [Altererythrobacter sp.]